VLKYAILLHSGGTVSFQTLYHEVSISKQQLLDLFLDQGNLLLQLNGQKPMTIKEFSEQGVLREENGVAIYRAKIHGVSENTHLSYIDGTVRITPIQNNENYMCYLKLQLHDHFD
jgi:hypothetical protein